MPLVPWLWDQLLHGADGGLARSRDGYVPGFVDPTDRFVGEKLGEVADRVVVASGGGAVSDRDARIATALDELPAISRIKAAKERHEREIAEREREKKEKEDLKLIARKQKNREMAQKFQQAENIRAEERQLKQARFFH